MRIKGWGIYFFSLLLFSIAASVFARSLPILPSGDHVWFATGHGLHRYNTAQDEWSVFSLESGLAGNDVRDIGIDEGIIWVATDGGISNSDVRFSDWRSYTTSDGLPGDDVRCVAFSEDYVWIGTSAGVARFDKLLEEWESFTEADGLAGDQVNDIVIDTDTAWFATSNGVSELDIEFDKWTSYTSESGLPSMDVTQAIMVGEYVWFVTDKGLARYDKQLRSWKSYTIADGIVSYLINDVVTDSEDIWLATEEGVSTYDAISDSWSVGIVYNALLPSKNVITLDMDGNIIWFCTDNGVSSYDRETGAWRHYTDADGMLDNSCQAIGITRQVFVVTEKGINFYDKGTAEWETYKFPEVVTGAVLRERSERGLRLDESGVGFDLSKEAQVRLSGSSSLEFWGFMKKNEWDTKNDISLRGTIPGGRSIVGFYDDTDEDDREYGVTYRGNDTDLLHEVTGGEFEARMRNSEFIEDMNLIGGGARLRKKFDGVRLNVEPRYGKQRGYFETDFLIYKTGTTMYELSHHNIIPETDEVIARKEKLQRGDYLVDYTNGWIVFHQEELIEEGSEVEVRYQYELSDDEDAQDDAPIERRLAMLTTGADIGDNYYAGLDMLHGDDVDVISLNGEGKKIGVGPVSMKLRPEIAYSRRQEDDLTTDGMASRAELIANAPRTQFKAEYEEYWEDFWTPGRRETRFGELDRHVGIFSRFDMTQWMPLTVRWQQDRSSDDDMVTTSEEDVRMNIVVSRKPYPTVALTGERDTARSSKEDSTRNAARADFQYELPESLLSLVKLRRMEVNSYYKEAYGSSMDERDRTQTGYVKLNLSPMEQFVLSASYKMNRAREKDADSADYRLRNELQRLLFRSTFASVDGIMSTLHLDDLSFRSRSADGDLVEDRDRYFAASLNLLPGAWVRSLEMLTLSGRYSLIQQTVPMASLDPESEEEQRTDSNARSLRLQANLRPHSTMLWTGTYDRVKSWIESVTPIRNTRKYRGEAEFKPGSKHRIVLEYSQEHEDEGASIQTRLYSPALWWETRWSQSWTTRLRSVLERRNIREEGAVSETGSTVTPSLSFRYTARELPYGGRLYISQGFSVSVYRAEIAMSDRSSETYSTSLTGEWKITRNFSFRTRAGLSYEDNHTQGKADDWSADVYVRALAKF